MPVVMELEQVRDDLRERLNSLTHDLLHLPERYQVPETYDEEARAFARIAARIDVELFEIAPSVN